MKYEIYQVKLDENSPESLRMFALVGYNVNESDTIKLKEHYGKVYEGEIDLKSDILDTLEDLFRIFNVDHPKDYRGRSLTASDVVKIGDEYFLCASAGWRNVKVI